MGKAQSYALTVENVMLLDAYDDFHEAYRRFADIVRTIGGHLGLRSDEGFEEASRLFNPLLKKYRCFFCGPELELTVKKKALICFYNYAQFGVDVENRSELTDRAFNWFLKMFQYMIARILIDCEDELIESLGIKGNWEKMDAYFIDRINDRIVSRIKESVRVSVHESSDTIPISKEELHLYYNLTTTTCRLKHHEIVSSKYVGRIMDRSEKIVLPVHYCLTCRKYMMGITTLTVLEKRYGRFDIKTVADQDLHDFDSTRFACYSGETLLRELGYTVRKDGLTKLEREALLIRLLKENKITYHEMCVTIERNIRSFSSNPRFYDAVQCWRSDLKFISAYIRDNT